MNVVLSSELVIGNFLIEAVSHEYQEVHFSKILEFEDTLNKKLQEEKRNCYADVLFKDVAETIGIFGRYFNEKNGVIHIKVDGHERESLLNRLIIFFRRGLPSWLTDMLSVVWETVFAV